MSDAMRDGQFASVFFIYFFDSRRQHDSGIMRPYLRFSIVIVSDLKPLPLQKGIQHEEAQYTCVTCQSHGQPIVCIIH